MSFSKGVDLLKLAMMATGRTGICHTDIEIEFGCVRRTAQRMVRALQQAFPATEHYIGQDGRHYWRLPSRAVAPLLSPDVDELVAVRSGIESLRKSGMLNEANALRRVDRKIRALVPDGGMARLATDEEAILEAMGYAARPGPQPSHNPVVDAAIAEALKGPFLLQIKYRSRADKGSRWRGIQPFGLLLGTRRYLVGIDTDQSGSVYRRYRIEDISDAKVSEESFEYPAHFDLDNYAQKSFGSFFNEREYGEVVWKFAPDAADRATSYQFHPNQKTELLKDGSLIVSFKAAGHLEMAWHLYSWGDGVEVIKPSALADVVHPHRRGDFASYP